MLRDSCYFSGFLWHYYGLLDGLMINIYMRWVNNSNWICLGPSHIKPTRWTWIIQISHLTMVYNNGTCPIMAYTNQGEAMPKIHDLIRIQWSKTILVASGFYSIDISNKIVRYIAINRNEDDHIIVIFGLHFKHKVRFWAIINLNACQVGWKWWIFSSVWNRLWSSPLSSCDYFHPDN